MVHTAINQLGGGARGAGDFAPLALAGPIVLEWIWRVCRGWRFS